MTVTCAVIDGDKPMSVWWTLNDVNVSRAMPGITMVPLGDAGSLLTLSPVRFEHAGNYTCFISNAGGVTFHTSQLRVNVPPELQPFALSEKPLNPGQILTVPCGVIDGDRPVGLHWEFNSGPITPRMGVTVVHLGERSAILSISSVQAAHAGTYTCVAENAAGTDRLSVELVVKVFPIIVPFSFGDLPSNSGDVVQVMCLVSKGDVPLNISWQFQGPLTDLSMPEGAVATLLGDRTSMLMINPVKAVHQGNYTCHATNRAGETSHFATLIYGEISGTFVVVQLLMMLSVCESLVYSTWLHVIPVLPRIVPFHFDTPIFAGQATQVTCLVSEGDSPLDISWSFQGTDLSSQMGISTTRIGRSGSLLLLEPANSGHRGNYTCTVKNPAGIVNYTTSLEIHGTLYESFLPRIVPFHFDSPIFAGQATQVTCLVSEGDFPLDITWSFQGTELSSQMGISTNKIGKKASLLLIDPATSGHKGNYTCTVRNPAGTINFTASLHIHVELTPLLTHAFISVPPRIVPFHFDTPIFAGQTTQVTCLVPQGDSPLDISWSFQGTELSSQMGLSTNRFSRKASILLVDPASSGHRGNYTCSVRNPVGSVNYTAHLQIHVKPQIQPFAFERSGINEGSSTRALCSVNAADTPLDIRWLKDGLPLSTATRKIHKLDDLTMILSLSHVALADSGNYTCIASNTAGIASHSAILRVKGRVRE
ncbi:hypothetical protein PR048_000861 [Dryococelus australis]|uniref:Ig-like domain-containing protein n=1 Tax=Dryococelus australis TaxID=614101 RepID=A0ABQ9IH78_9NEOP|nr:hypothetical protein PR048_000861 [Dryococelus australis]